jgi:CDP-Glycerol:Poly(glycerophosphate) glycerophosphotransferase
MKHRFKKLAKAALGAENSYLARNIYDRIRFQLYCLRNYKSMTKPFDVLFFCPFISTWQHIKLVVEELSHRRRDLRLGLINRYCPKELFQESFYLTDNPTIINDRWRLNLFDTRVLYVSIPILSPLDRPRNAHMVHAVWSMNSLDGVFFDTQFDPYDYILCGGPHHLDSFREHSLRHPALLGKTLVPAGYPKLDLMLASHSTTRRPTDPSRRSTVVYAPTHISSLSDHLTSLSHYGEAIVNALIVEGNRVIFRPHKASFADQDRPVIDRICQLHADNPNFSLDMSEDYTETYSSADLMVTDLSGTGFTFSFSFGRPCIFFSASEEAERGLRGIQFEARHRIGALVRDINEMLEKTSELCNRDMTEEIERFRDETVFNVGKSAAYIVDCLEDILSGRKRPEWVRL